MILRGFVACNTMAESFRNSAIDNFRDKREETKSDNGKAEIRFPLMQWKLVSALSIFVVFGVGLLNIFLTMPASQYPFLKFPHTVEDLQMLRWLLLVYLFVHRDDLANYTKDYTSQVVLGYCATYIFMQTFMIPGTILMSLLAGALFGVIKGLVLVVFAATAGASSCYFLSKLIGRPIAFYLWPDKIRFFRAEVAKRREKLLNYMFFLRITPALPNTFINVASPIVGVPYHIFFFATFFGLIPAAYITVRAGLALGELKSLAELYDLKTIATLFFIGLISITPTLLTGTQTHA